MEELKDFLGRFILMIFILIAAIIISGLPLIIAYLTNNSLWLLLYILIIAFVLTIITR